MGGDGDFDEVEAVEEGEGVTIGIYFQGSVKRCYYVNWIWDVRRREVILILWNIIQL